jgi:hypothetical protein
VSRRGEHCVMRVRPGRKLPRAKAVLTLTSGGDQDQARTVARGGKSAEYVI